MWDVTEILDDGVVSERGYEHHERNVAECMICYLSLRTGHGQGLETPSELTRFCRNAGQAGSYKYFDDGETCKDTSNEISWVYEKGKGL